jgi:hypothetical protein
MLRTSTKSAMRPAPGAIASATRRQEPVVAMPKSDGELPSQESRMNQIARRAHEIYEARGGTDGKALEDWLQAEREIDTAMGRSEG